MSATRSLNPIFGLRLFHSLPLHVARGIGPSAGERDDMVDDPARAPFRIARLPGEGVSGRRAPLDPAALVARKGRRGNPLRCRWLDRRNA